MEKALFEKFKDMNKDDLSESLIDAVKSHNMDEIRYLLTSSELKEHADINIYMSAPLRNAVKYGFFEIVEYLLTSSELKEYADISAETNYPFKTVCMDGNLKILKFFLESPKLTKKIDVHLENDLGFRSAFVGKQLEIMQYFIFDLNIEKTQPIKRCIDNYLNSTNSSVGEHIDFAKKVQNMFNIRDLNQKLEKDLSAINNNQKRIKL